MPATRLGRHEEALEQYALALRVSREIGDRPAEGWACHYLTEAPHSSGRSAEAGQYWRRAIELFDALGDPLAGDIPACPASADPNDSSIRRFSPGRSRPGWRAARR